VNQFPIWSSDSKRVTFQSDQPGGNGIFWQPADGSAVPERLTTPDKDTVHIPEAWSPDGRHLLFSAVTREGATLWTLFLPERQTARFDDVTSSGPLNAEYSPDGRWVAYTVRQPGTANIFVQPVPPTGAHYQVSKDDLGHHPEWAHSGKELFYRPGASALVHINITTNPVFTFSNPVAEPTSIVALTTSTNPRNHDLFPDDRRFIITSPNVADSNSLVAGSPRINVVLNWTEELKQRVPTR
jgi:hypothetical protein